MKENKLMEEFILLGFSFTILMIMRSRLFFSRAYFH